MRSRRRRPALVSVSSALRFWLLAVTVSCGKDIARSHKAEQANTEQTPARETQVISCDAARNIFCVTDTARARIIATEPGRLVEGSVLIFAFAGDSVELDGHASASDNPGRIHGAIALSTNLGQDRLANHNTAPYFRRRIEHTGLLTVDIDFLESDVDTVPFVLMVTRSSRLEQPRVLYTGSVANLDLTSELPEARFTVIPIGSNINGIDPRRWLVPARRYKVLLTSDSLYAVCRFPCAKPDTIKLIADQSVRFRR